MLIVGIAWSAKRQNHARQLARWKELEWLQALSAATPGAELAEVTRVYQSARFGTKAVITWLASGRRQDAWFEGNWPGPGAVVLLCGVTGWGPHNRNPDVFFVLPDELLAMMSAGTRKALLHNHMQGAKRAR
ncbi:hypothetical protein [Kutzneria sp. NPDC051319]|uniref:hypothetical protein n=1 Tax=Kutzneria sp. NPDC051319 TaxID=3155047 RepID=UPI0034136FDB